MFVASGIRPDLIAADPNHGAAYIDELVAHHVSGQLKLAPEHADPRVLRAMGKPGQESLLDFVKLFRAANERHHLKQFLTYYFIAAHPGCGDAGLRSAFASRHLRRTRASPDLHADPSRGRPRCATLGSTLHRPTDYRHTRVTRQASAKISSPLLRSLGLGVRSLSLPCSVVKPK